MKNLKNFFILLCVVLFFLACKKEDNPTVYDSISGVITAGENVTNNDFSSIQIILGKLIDEVDISSEVFTSEDIDFIRYSDLKTDGSFSFENLDNGNYILTPSDGFIFSIDTFAIVTIDGISLKQLNKTIERGIPENCFCW